MRRKPAVDGKMGAGEVGRIKQTQSFSPHSRRAFLVSIAGVAPFAVKASTIGLLPARLKGVEAEAAEGGSESAGQRRNQAFQIRHQAALRQRDLPLPLHPNNGEEKDYPYLANYSKGLPPNSLGEVDPAAYKTLLEALSAGGDTAFERIPLGGVRPLRNPQAGIAFDLEGPDSHHLAIRPAPRIDGPENSSEMAELYWMALARDVNFTAIGHIVQIRNDGPLPLN